MLKLLSNRPDNDSGSCLSWLPADTQELFEKNLLIQPQDWSWRSRSVTYTLNSQGFRCGEFDSLAWSDSIVAFGCSNTMGIGLDDLDTWPHKLSQFLKRPVINLAQGAQGWSYNWVNSVRVMQEGHRPRAVIYYWPDAARMFTWPESRNLNLINGHGAWDLGLDLNSVPSAQEQDFQLARLWLTHPHMSDFWAEQYKHSLDIMWNGLGVPVYHYTYQKRSQHLGLDYIPLYSDPHNLMSRARDLMHPGVADQIRVAVRIYSKLGWLSKTAEQSRANDPK